MKRKRKAMSFTEKPFKQIKQRPLRTAAKTVRASLSASVTLEASLILPLFLFMMLNLMTILNVIRVQSTLEAAVTEAGRRAAVHAFDINFTAAQIDATTGSGLQNGTQTTTSVLGISYAINIVNSYMQEHCPDLSCVQGGLKGIDFMQSGFWEDGGTIHIVARYTVQPMFGLMSFMSFSMEADYYGHAWTGYSGGTRPESSKTEQENEIVFVTPHGSVYHRSPNCTYLKPSVSQVSQSAVQTMRNRDGGKYYPCEGCKGTVGGTCFITSYGDRYHSDPGCNKIYHDIIAVPKCEVSGKGCCSKCGSE